MKPKLWTRNFTLLITATVLGCAGGVASGFALSFLVFDETGSTLAAALLIAMQLIPSFIIPLVAAPVMDRLPRKPFLVGGDAVNGLLYALAGLYLLKGEFSYTLYLGFSLLLSTLGTFDMLAYNSLYPNLIPEGCEQKGYAVSGTLYPVVNVVMTPVAAILYDKLGVGVILLIQSTLSLLAALTESQIRVQEPDRRRGEKFSFAMWKADLAEALDYLRGDEGLKAIYGYMAVTNGIGNGYSPILVAFFRTFPGFTTVMYSAFSVAEFAGRAVGGLFHYHKEIPQKKRFGFAFFVYQAYELMDMILLWIPYPLMLVNRAVCGFLGVNSASLREAAVQKHIPDHLRAKLNAFLDMLISLSVAAFGLIMGAMGEVMDYRLCISISACVTCLTCWSTIWRRRKHVRAIYQREEVVSDAGM
ncbi:MAG: MFS transporter [Clostridia bacterium]|nr:MFS transporter [Clostridia bacterium]